MLGRKDDPWVVIETKKGNIVVHLFAQQVPTTVANFLKYVDANLFEASTFFRLLNARNQAKKPHKIQVIQGGLKSGDDRLFSPIPHESTAVSGLSHKDGTISMSRFAPGSAAGSFFICIDEQPDLDFEGERNPDGLGFAAFGQVVQGMSVVRNIWQCAEDGREYVDNEVAICRVQRYIRSHESF